MTFVLAKPGFPLLPERQFTCSAALEGDSHLAITKPAFTPPRAPDAIEIKVRTDTSEGHFEFRGFPNKEGFLGKIETEPFEAEDMTDAQRKAYRALTPFLSNWSVHLDIPLSISQIDTTELRTGNAEMKVLAPFWVVPFSVAPQQYLPPEFRGFASLYREALNSNSPVYRFLCLFKIIDGVLARRRRLGADARAAGKPFSRPPEFIPETRDEFVPWLNAIFPIRPEWGWEQLLLHSIFREEALGKRIKRIIDSELYPLRNAIAHALSTKSGELSLSVDEMLHTEKVNRWLPLTKCIARRILKNEFPAEFLSYLREDGTIVSGPSSDSEAATGVAGTASE